MSEDPVTGRTPSPTAPSPVTPAPILVGIDGSPQSTRAVEYAALDAARRGAPVTLAHVVTLPQYAGGEWAPMLPDDTVERRERVGRELLAQAAQTIRSLAPTVPVTEELRTGAVVPRLLELAHDAQSIIVAAHGHGGFAGLLVGSVSQQLARHAPCPVVVVRGRVPEQQGGRVVVGVAGAESEAAVRRAFQEAALRDAELVTVHAWTHPALEGGEGSMPILSDLSDVNERQELALAQALADWGADYPAVKATPKVVIGHAAKALLREATDADLLVVGSHGGGGFTGMLLGSVSHAVLHHATCTVEVVR